MSGVASRVKTPQHGKESTPATVNRDYTTLGPAGALVRDEVAWPPVSRDDSRNHFFNFS